jgi:hypothetical protein
VSAGPSVDPEAEYYQAVEECFVSRRGESLFLSNADWHLVRKWREAALPLRVVLRGIRDAFESHAHGWSRDRPVRSLAYCTHDVEAARERWERALSLGRDDGPDASGALRGFADDLERARGLASHGAAAAARIGAELRRRADGGELAELEPWLGKLEAELLEAIRKDDGPERVAAIEGEVARALEPYEKRMPPRVLEQLRGESLARRMLEAHGLPRLSLFHLEGGGGKEATP